MKKILSIILAASMVFALAACGGGSSSSASAPQAESKTEEAAPAGDAASSNAKWRMKFAHCMSASSGYQAYAEKFKELVEAGSNGEIAIEIYPASQLGGERETNEAAQLGTVDFSYTSAAPLATFAKGFDVYNLPFLFEDREHAHAFFDSADGDARLAELESAGLIGLAWGEVDFFNLFLTQPVVEPEDMNGLTVRCLENTFYMTYLSMLGANPVPMAWSEVPAAMTNGTIQGCCTGVPGSYDLSMFKGNYYMEGDITWGPCPVVMSKIVYDQLPAEYQELIRKSAKEAVVYQREWYAEHIPTMLQEMKDGGAEVVQINRDAWIAKVVKPVYDKMIADGLVDPEDLKKIDAYRKNAPIYVVE